MYFKCILLTVLFVGFWIDGTKVDAVANALGCAGTKPDPQASCRTSCKKVFGTTYSVGCCINTFIKGFAAQSVCICCPGTSCPVTFDQELVCIDQNSPICKCDTPNAKFKSYMDDECPTDPTATLCQRYTAPKD